MREITILVGPPASGKGTIGPKLAEKAKIPVLSTGDMLRDAVTRGSEIGKQADAAMKRGELVGDEIVIGIVKERVSEQDCEKGFILDGFPRTLNQAKALDTCLLAAGGDKVTMVMVLKLPEDVLLS